MRPRGDLGRRATRSPGPLWLRSGATIKLLSCARGDLSSGPQLRRAFPHPSAQEPGRRIRLGARRWYREPPAVFRRCRRHMALAARIRGVSPSRHGAPRHLGLRSRGDGWSTRAQHTRLAHGWRRGIPHRAGSEANASRAGPDLAKVGHTLGRGRPELGDTGGVVPAEPGPNLTKIRQRRPTSG